MVLQRNSNVPVWGWGTASETIKIVGSWAPEDTIQIQVENLFSKEGLPVVPFRTDRDF